MNPSSSSTLVTWTWNSSTFWSSETMSPCRHCVRRLSENQKGFAPIFFSSSSLGKWGQKERVAKSEEEPLGRESLLEDWPANDRLLVRQTISQSLCTTSPHPIKHTVLAVTLEQVFTAHITYTGIFVSLIIWMHFLDSIGPVMQAGEDLPIWLVSAVVFTYLPHFLQLWVYYIWVYIHV